MKNTINTEVTRIPESRTPTIWLIAGASLLAPAISLADIYIWAEESDGNTTISFSGSFEASTLAGQDDVDDPSSNVFVSGSSASTRGSGNGGSMGIGTKNGANEFVQRYSDNSGENQPGTESELVAISPNTGNVYIPADISTGDSFSVDFELGDLDFILASDYVPGTTTSGSSTWLGKSLADIGFSSTATVEVVIKGPLGEKIVYFGRPPVETVALSPDNSAAKASLLKKIKGLKKKVRIAKRKMQAAKVKRFSSKLKKLKRQLQSLG